MRLIRKLIVSIVNPILRKIGAELVPISRATSLESCLERLRARGMDFGTVVDVGASDGRWSELAHGRLPKPYYLLIEAQDTHVAGLSEFKRRVPNSDFVMAAAGDEIGELYFDATDPLGGVASHEPIDDGSKVIVRVPVTTIDSEIDKRGWPGPYLIKLDTHGFELPILAGASRALSDAAVLIIEAYNFKVAPDSLRFHELINFLEKKGFRVLDICEPIFRKRDGALWQLDLIFARHDRVEFKDNNFAGTGT